MKALSAREQQVVELAIQGCTDKEIAERLALSTSTVRAYWIRIRQKCMAVNRCQVVARYLEASREGSE